MNDSRATTILESGLRERNLDVIAGAYGYFIRKGKAGSENALIQALEECGAKEMATDFLNCQNDKLREAARVWAKEHGYNISVLRSDDSNPLWGRTK